MPPIELLDDHFVIGVDEVDMRVIDLSRWARGQTLSNPIVTEVGSDDLNISGVQVVDGTKVKFFVSRGQECAKYRLRIEVNCGLRHLVRDLIVDTVG